jgi:glycerol-3-phosphate acyltransferase PlsY
VLVFANARLLALQEPLNVRGVALGLFWPVGLGFCVMWLLVATATRYSSLAALISSAATVGTFAVLQMWPLAVLFGVLTVLLYIRHAANIQRLLQGEETRIGEDKH